MKMTDKLGHFEVEFASHTHTHQIENKEKKRDGKKNSKIHQ